MKGIGLGLVLLGLSALLLAATRPLWQEFTSLPLIIRIGLGALAVGVVLLLAMVGIEKVRRGGE